MPTKTINYTNTKVQNSICYSPNMTFRSNSRSSNHSDYSFLSSESDSDSFYKPLSSGIIGFTAEMIATVIPCSSYDAHHPKTRYLPELLPFINKVCRKCKLDLRTMLFALIYAKRFGEALERQGNCARGEYGTCHRIFLAAILLAVKAQVSNGCLNGIDNNKLADCTDGIWGSKDIEMMERALASTIGFDFIVDEETVKGFVEEHRSELCWFR